MDETMDETGKWFASVMLIGFGGFLVVLCVLIGVVDPILVLGDLWVYMVAGIAMALFGAVIFYLRHVSVTSQTRVTTAKVTRVVRDVPKPKPKPTAEELEAAKPKGPEILCNTCQFYAEYNPKQKCRYLTDQDRMDMINAGLECVEYKIKLALLDED